MNTPDNIEKLIKNAVIHSNPDVNRAVLKELLQQFDNAETQKPIVTKPNVRRKFMKSHIKKIAAAAVVTLAALVGIKMIADSAKEPGDQTIKYGDTSNPVETPRVVETLHAELNEVRQMAVVGDVKGLATMLSKGRLESKLVAANFLAKMGKMPALVEMPAIETLSMHASGELILDSPSGNIRLRSTNSKDWLEMTADTLHVHTAHGIHEANQVRLTYDIRGDDERWEKHEREFANLRRERTDLEKELAQLSKDPSIDIDPLRKRLAKYNEMLDSMDEAVYASIENGRMKLNCPFRHRTAQAELRDGIIRVEWHGHIVKADSVTLLLGLAPVRTDGPPPPVPGWRARFDRVYSLDDEEVLRWVRYPFIPERQIYATQEMPYHASKNPPPPGYIAFQWDGKLHPWTIAMHECALGSVLNAIGLKRYEIDGPEKLLGLKLGGDWIARRNVSTDDTLSTLERILENGLNRKVRFEKQEVNRDVIIVRGQYKHVPLEGVKRPGRFMEAIQWTGT